MRTKFLRTALMAAGAVLLVAGTASAQDNGRYDRSGYDRDNPDYDNGYDNPAGYESPDENVQILTPHYNYGMGKLGVPNVRVFLSRAVRFDDLDLRTRSGARTLRNRVKLTARLLCRDIDERWPVTADNGGDQATCYHDAAENALYRAHRFIAEARRYND
jgi:UrcA family protein